jgi:flagellar basal-body rod protein FlgF
MPVARDRDFRAADQQLSFTQDWGTLHDVSPGAMIQTGNPLDLALQGEGFLAVTTPGGERWTARPARCRSTPTACLSTPMATRSWARTARSGSRYRDRGQHRRDGTISTNEGAKGRLRIVEFDNPQELVREGDNLRGRDTGSRDRNARRPGRGREVQRLGRAEMTEMIRVQRAYQSLASMMQRQDDMRRSAIQRLGDVTRLTERPT